MWDGGRGRPLVGRRAFVCRVVGLFCPDKDLFLYEQNKWLRGIPKHTSDLMPWMSGLIWSYGRLEACRIAACQTEIR